MPNLTSVAGEQTIESDEPSTPFTSVAGDQTPFGEESPSGEMSPPESVCQAPKCSWPSTPTSFDDAHNTEGPMAAGHECHGMPSPGSVPHVLELTSVASHEESPIDPGTVTAEPAAYQLVLMLLPPALSPQWHTVETVMDENLQAWFLEIVLCLVVKQVK